MIFKKLFIAMSLVSLLWASGCALDAGCSCGKDANEYGFVVHEAACDLYDPESQALAERLAELEEEGKLSSLSDEDQRLWDELIVP